MPSTLTVMNLSDTGIPGDGSLRGEIAAAGLGDTIDFAHGLHGTITLTNGQLPITASLTIDGPGANKLSVSGNDVSRIFDISGRASVAISGLTITEGRSTLGGGILLEDPAALSISACTLTDNQALGIAYHGTGGCGGGIEDHSTGALTVTDSTFDNNKAIGIGTDSAGASEDDYGTGLFAFGGAINMWRNLAGTATISGSTFTGNEALGGSPGVAAGGGALSNSSHFGATMAVTGCTISGNSAIGAAGGDGLTNFGFGQGGGINNLSSLTVRDSTLTDNLALGAPLAASAVAVQDVTLNTAVAGGGIVCLDEFVPSTVVIADSTLRGNQAVGGAGAAGLAGSEAGGGGISLILVGPDGVLAGGGGGPAAVVDRCLLTDNVARGGAGGSGGAGAPGASGGIDILFSSAIVSNTILIHNQAIGGAGGAGATGGDGVGGGIGVGTGNLIFGPGADSSSLTLTDSLVVGNQAVGGAGGSGSNGGDGLGGGLAVLAGSSAGVSTSLIVANQAQGGAGGAGGGDGQGVGGGVCNLGAFNDTFTLIKGNHASTSNDDVFT